MFVLRRAGIASTVQWPKLVLSLHNGSWHAANAMNFLIMKLHTANIVPARVQLAMRQNFCFPHLLMLRRYNSTTPNWCQT
jgi:hypothetical protein